MARTKFRQNTAACAAAGWVCKTFVDDVYGALRTDARKLISEVIARRASRFHHYADFPLCQLLSATGLALY